MPINENDPRDPITVTPTRTPTPSPAPGETPAGSLADYQQVAARTEEIVTTLPDLSATRPLPEAPWGDPRAVRSVRRVPLHLIAETAQHAGHADPLRETLDGRTR